MSLSYADVLLKDPAHLFELLYSKYGNIDEDLEQLYINQVVYNKKTHYDTLYKEFQFTDILEEFLRRYYKSNESFPRIPKLAKYYKNYHLFFCKPVFCEWRINLIMSKYGDTKAEIYYKDNYGNDSKLKNDNDQNIETSSSESSEIVDNNKYKQNTTKTIFDKNTRKFIDNNNNNNVKNKTNSKQPNESLVLNICDDSKLNQTLGLISRRSNNTSFIDLMKTLSVKVNTPSAIKYTKNNNKSGINSNNNNTNNVNSIHFNNNNNRNSGLVGSLCSLTKRIPDLPNSNTKTTNRFLISPKIKMYLNNGKAKTKLSEFHYNNPINLNNINKQKQLIPIINASSNTSNNNNNNNNTNNYNINIVVPFHQKNKSYQQNSIGTNNNNNNNNNNNSINNFFHNHKSTRLTRNNSKKLSYNLSLKKNSFQSNPISNVHSLSNNNNNNNKTTNRKTRLNIIKSPQHSSVNNYFNMVFNLTHNNKKDIHHHKPSNTKTFFVQQSQRSNSYKTNNSNNNKHLVHHNNNNNRNSRNQNFIKTNANSVKSLSKTKTIFTRSVDDKNAQRGLINKGNAILNSNNQVNAMINILNKQQHHQHHMYIGSEEKKHFHIFNHVSSRSNNLQECNGKENKMKHSKGGMMLKTLNGFNVGSNNKLRIMQNKKMK